MAVWLIETWSRLFTNQGGASLHDCPFKGFTEWADFRGEVMQLDGGMGIVYAISELFVHEFQGELRCFFGIPKHWKHAAITNLRTAGGFLFSGICENGSPVQLKIKATRDNTLRLHLPGISPLLGNSDRMECFLKAGEELTL